MTGWERIARMRSAWLALFFFAATFALFSSVLGLGFILYDDPSYVTRNEYVKSGLSLDTLHWAFTGFAAVNYHPLAWLSHALDVELWGMNPFGHHLTALLLHASSAALMFLAAEAMMQRRGIALFVAAGFAFHPQRVESVAWVAERKDVLATFFFLLMLLAYVQGHRRNSPALRVAAVLALILGMLGKPMLVTAPAVLVLVDVAFLGRFDGKARQAVVIVVEKLPLYFLSALDSWATTLAQKPALDMTDGFTMSDRVQNSASALVVYVEKFFVPQGLSTFYAVHVAGWGSVVVGVVVIVVGVVVGVFFYGRRRRGVLIGWLWFLGMLVPVIGIVQVGAQGMADRYTYLPHIGLLIATASMAEALYDARVAARRYLVVFAIGWIGMCAAFTRAQIEIWRSTESMWRWAIDLEPDNAAAHGMLAGLCLDKGDDACALEHAAAAVQLGTANIRYHENLSIALVRTGHLDDADAVIRGIVPAQASPISWRLWSEVARRRGDCHTAVSRMRIAISQGERVGVVDGECAAELRALISP